jgi:nitrate reductase beta subunit
MFLTGSDRIVTEVPYKQDVGGSSPSSSKDNSLEGKEKAVRVMSLDGFFFHLQSICN